MDTTTAHGVDDPLDWGDTRVATDPYPVLRRLRGLGGALAAGEQVLAVRKSAVEEVLRDPARFSSALDMTGAGEQLIPLEVDPPDHLRYRKLLDPLFAPRAIAALEPDITAMVDSLIDAVIDDGECDFTTAFAVPLPSSVFLRLLGLPLADTPRFIGWKDAMLRGSGVDADGSPIDQVTAAARIWEMFEQTLAARSAEPRDDLISWFLRAEIEGERLSHQEILGICFLFLLAGLDTVTNALGCSWAYLVGHPAHREAIVADPSLIPAAIEELLRRESPVTEVMRVATADTEIEGCPVRAGQRIRVCLAGANTDDAEFDEPDVADFARTSNRHLAFGGGIHRCLGSHLARLELRLALRRWHERIPEYRLAPGHELQFDGTAIRSVDYLPLVWDR